ncbi:MAG: LamG-like jellyroll fold domain-containing protein [Luteolibacter sp.]
MRESEPRSGALEVADLWRQLAELEDGSLDPAQRDELMSLLDESRAARRLYAEYFALSVGLEAQARYLDQQGKLPVLADVLRPWRMFRRSLLAAAALVAIGTIVAALVVVKRPEPRRLTAAATADARWMVDGLAQSPAASEWKVTAGSTVQVLSGTVKLRLDPGAAMVMQGPAKASFPELDKPVLNDGWLWIDSGESGEAFEIKTPNLLVRDIGTRFGVRVPEKGPDEVHLVKGKVEVLAKSTRKTIATLEPDGRGLAIAATGKPATLALARDPFPGLADLLVAPGNYPTTVRSQNPAGYWRMEEAAPGALDNEVPEGLVGRRHPQVRLGEPGPGPDSGFHGFGRGNPSARLPANPDAAPLLLGATPIHTGEVMRDDFNAPHDYTSGIAGTIWHGVVNAENAVSLNAGTSTTGRLRIAATDGKGWDAGSNNAPFLYMNVSGDFDARVEVPAQTAGDYSVAALMARLGAPAANGKPGEDYMTVTSNRFGSNNIQARTLRDGAQNDSIGSSHADFPRHLRLTRTGNTFHAFVSADGRSWQPVSWGGLRGLPIGVGLVREDLDGLPLQVGLWQGSFKTSGHSADFDNFHIWITPDPSSRPDSHPGGPPARVARKEGAVSFWMRREPGVKRREILWAAGENMADDAIHARLDADGRVAFFMEDGRYDLLITSEESIADGRWHHLAASWSPTAVNLYLDGQRAGSDTEYRAMQQGILPELRFGSGPAGFGDPSFTGWIDEVALWDRALTPAEVRHQFHSARGK